MKYSISATNPKSFWTSAITASAQNVISNTLLALCVDQTANVSTTISGVASARRRLLAGSVATSSSLGFANDVDLASARAPSAALLAYLASALASLGFTGVTVSLAASASPSSSGASADTLVIVTVVPIVVGGAVVVALIIAAVCLFRARKRALSYKNAVAPEDPDAKNFSVMHAPVDPGADRMKINGLQL